MIIVMAFFGSVAYWQLPPFFPKFCVRKNIDKAWVGFVMSANAGLFLITALLTGKYLLRCVSRINMCLIGSFFIVSKTELINRIWLIK